MTAEQDINRNVSAAIFLGLVSGFPLLLTSGTLQTWCVAAGAPLSTVGALSLLGWPYLLKFLWAPMLEWAPYQNCASTKKMWIVFLAAMVALGIAIMATLGPKHLHALWLVAACVAFGAATLDAAIDGYRIELLPAKKYGVIAGGGLVMYRIALILTGGVLLIVADHYSWHIAFYCAALGMCCLALLCCFLPTRSLPKQHSSSHTSCRQIWAKALDLPFHPNQKYILLAFVVLFKSSDAFVVNMGPAFLIRHCGLSLSHLGMLYKVAGVLATLLGTMAASTALHKYPLKVVVNVSLGAQVITLSLFLCLAVIVHPGLRVVDLTVVLECFASGLTSTVLVTFLMRCCAKGHATTRYAFLSALPASLGILIGPCIGLVAQSCGWVGFFLMAVAFAMLPCCILCLPHTMAALEDVQAATHP